jgi:hypothetical protein
MAMFLKKILDDLFYNSNKSKYIEGKIKYSIIMCLMKNKFNNLSFNLVVSININIFK